MNKELHEASMPGAAELVLLDARRVVVALVVVGDVVLVPVHLVMGF